MILTESYQILRKKRNEGIKLLTKEKEENDAVLDSSNDNEKESITE